MSEKSGRRASIIVTFLLAFPLAAALALPASSGASLPPAMGDWTVTEDTVITAPVLLRGNLTVRSGVTLTFDHAILYMNESDSWVMLENFATLRFLSGSLQDSPTDVDDFSAADHRYTVSSTMDSVLEFSASSWQGASLFTGDMAVVRLVDSSVRLHGGPIRLLQGSSLSATNTTFVQDAGLVFDIEDTSFAEIAGKGLPSYSLNGGWIEYSSFLTVQVNDTTGKPLIGADWAVETSAGVLAGSPAFGGAQQTTRLDLEGHFRTQWVKVPHLLDTGAAAVTAGVIVRARVAEWSEARFVNTSMDQIVAFTSMNRGVVLEDGSHHAMLDVYHGMEDMMMGDMGMGGMDMGHMGGMDMGGMEMMGPMMTQGPGSAWGDFDGDGHVDAIVTSAPETDHMMLMMMGMNITDYPAPQLFHGMGDGSFHHSMMSGLDNATGAQGISAGDFDGDGDLDLFVARYGFVGMIEDMLDGSRMEMDGEPLQSMLFRNDGHGMFEEVTQEVGFSMPPKFTTGGVWNDYNRDGCLDLYVVNMGQMAMLMMEGQPMEEMHMGMDMNFVKPQANYLFKNDCAGHFIDVTAAAGAPTGGLAPGQTHPSWQSLHMDNATQYWYARDTGRALSGSGVSYTAAFFDYNEDGWPDLLVANDFGISPLYRNNGDGTFTLQTAEAGFAKVGSAMGFAIADFNRDGHLDVFQSNFNEDYLWMANGDGTFTDRAMDFGVDDMAVGWGVAAPDINSDGYPDLVMSVGYMSMMMKASERSVVYVNDGGNRFWDGSAGSGIDEDPAVGISVATADVDEDGKLDFFLGKTTGMNKLYLNREAGANHIRIDLRGMSSNSYGVGATVTATVGGKPFIHVVQPGGEYASSNEPGVFIGLGDEMEAKGVIITWPSGVTQPLGNLMAGARITAREMVDSKADAGPDGNANTSMPTVLTGHIEGAPLPGASYKWIFHGPTLTQTVDGKDAHFTPPAPGVYTAEFIVTDRFGQTFGSDFCIMNVADTSAPEIVVKVPATITASGKPTFDASNTSDNDPNFKVGGVYDWTFKNGALEVKATGAKPTVSLPKSGIWNVSLTVTDPSGNRVTQSFDARVTGASPSPLTQEMVVVGIALPLLSILAIAILQPRIWRRDGDLLAPEHFQELKPDQIVVASVADEAAPPFPFKPDRDVEEE